MDELFRFTINRPATRVNAVTLALQRDSEFQYQLINAAPEWPQMQIQALIFLEAHLSQWILPIVSQSAPQPIAGIQQLLDNLQSLGSDAHPQQWQLPLQTMKGQVGVKTLTEWNVILADLFLALVIMRAEGPAQTADLIRTRGITEVLADVIQDRPDLEELAGLLRMIDLLLAASPPASFDELSAALSRTLAFPPRIFTQSAKPIHAVGFTYLFLVKQHIARYELGEIARIENILKGESRNHSRTHTLSNERDTSLETSTETVTDQELTTADHVSLQAEIENTLKEDTKVDAGVHVQYDGGSVKAQADLTVAYDRSSSESQKSASGTAKDITQKAAKKVTQKVTQSLTTKIIETFRESEGQSFENKNGQNISGVYQWVDKVYLAQVFNYDRHLLFDIMVPEPAASLLLAASTPPPGQQTPIPPDPLGDFKVDSEGKKQLTNPLTPDQLNTSADANKWIGKYQVPGVEPQPPSEVVIADSVVADGRDQSHNDVRINKTYDVPDGYYTDSVSLALAWFTPSGQNDGMIDVQIGANNFHFSAASPADPSIHNTNPSTNNWGENDYSASVPNLQLAIKAQRSIGVSIKSINTYQVSVNFEISCKRIDAQLLAKWQLQTYEKIATRWQQLDADYQAKVAALQYQRQTAGPLAAGDPDMNRQIERNELKRGCIAILSNSPADGIDAVRKYDPSGSALLDPDLAVAEAQGATVRWFEQAFEWDKIGYVFYPYYWGRSSEWVTRLYLKNDDALFLNFLQAGYARVVVPVRKGFEDAVNFYLLTGRPWLGGGLPKVWEHGQNPLYLSLVEELKEQSGAPGSEKIVDEPPWEIRIPTGLIKLRDDGRLPSWKWDPPGNYPPAPTTNWSWEEDRAAEQAG